MEKSENNKFTLYLISIILLCLSAKYFAYHLNDFKYIVEKYMYTYNVSSMEMVDLEDVRNDLEYEYSGKRLYYVGRRSCGDCRSAILSIKSLENWSKRILGMKIRYMALPDELNAEDRGFITKNLKLDSIPAIVAMSEGSLTVIKYEDIMLEKEAKIKLKQVLEGGLHNEEE